MDDQTLIALKASIKKWEKNAKIENLENARFSPRSCPLCTLFLKKDCFGCPVRNKTGIGFCYKTPYLSSNRAFSLNDLFAFKTAALEEVTFLKSLLPNEAKP